jgi:hypothetical protein
MEIALSGSWKLNAKNQVVVKCVSDSNGKGIPGKKSWRARFEGLWERGGREMAAEESDPRLLPKLSRV